MRQRERGADGSWAQTMIRLRWAVLAAWIVLLVAAGAASSGLSDLLTNRFVLPGAESEKAGSILKNTSDRSRGLVLTRSRGETRSAQALVVPTRAAAIRAAKELPTGKVVDVRPVSADVVSASIASELQPADAKGHTDGMRRAAGSIPDAEVYLTGQSAIESDLEPVQNRDLKVGELYIAIPVALAILVFVFGTLAFLLPFMLAVFAIPVTLGVVWIFELHDALHLPDEHGRADRPRDRDRLLAPDGLPLPRGAEGGPREGGGRRPDDGHGRTRRGLQRDSRGDRAGADALHAPLPFMRGFGLAGLLIPLVSVLAALTLLPVLLYWLEDRLDRGPARAAQDRRAP